jgi:Winged helix-turn helix
MAGPRTTRTIVLAPEQRAELEHLQRSPSVAAGLARRARIVLLAADQLRLQQIAVRVGVQRRVVREWLDRFRAQGLAGLQDRPRSGRPRTFPP